MKDCGYAIRKAYVDKLLKKCVKVLDSKEC